MQICLSFIGFLAAMPVFTLFFLFVYCQIGYLESRRIILFWTDGFSTLSRFKIGERLSKVRIRLFLSSNASQHFKLKWATFRKQSKTEVASCQEASQTSSKGMGIKWWHSRPHSMTDLKKILKLSFWGKNLSLSWHNCTTAKHRCDGMISA